MRGAPCTMRMIQALKGKAGMAALAAGLLLGAGLPPAQAQTDWRAVAVPYYGIPAFMQGQLQFWYAPRAGEFEQAAAALARSVGAHCAGGPLAAARQDWRNALLAWSRLSGVAVGPLIERRSAQRVDYAPVRPEQIARAIASRPASEADLERLPNAAKGFGALEQLLWPPAAGGPPACPYAAQAAADIAREATALNSAFAQAGAGVQDEAAAVQAMSEAVNQWIGALERLRMQGIERPLREAQARRGRPVFARDASGTSAAERRVRWQGLQALAVLQDGPAPQPGAGLVPLETFLRGKGLNPLADRLVRSVREAGNALQAAEAGAPARLQAAARRLATLGALVEAEVAPALDIRVGFSDADGD
jgi:predicted lipoprotein